jgi:hypothetical protein
MSCRNAWSFFADVCQREIEIVEWIGDVVPVLNIGNDDGDADEDTHWTLDRRLPQRRRVGAAEAADWRDRMMCWMIAQSDPIQYITIYETWRISDVYQAWAIKRAHEYRPPRT